MNGTAGFYPTALYLSKRPGVNFSGTTILKREFTTRDFIGASWNGRLVAQKTISAQAMDQAMIFRVMGADYSRLTLAIAAGGFVDLRLRSANGLTARRCVTTVVPGLGELVSLVYSWDAVNKRLSLAVWTPTVSEMVTSVTQVSLPSWTEAPGIYIGNRADGTLGYQGRVLGGSFDYNLPMLPAETLREAKYSHITNSRTWLVLPGMLGIRGTTTVEEANGLNMTLVTTDLEGWWK